MADFDPAVIVVEHDGDTVVIDVIQPVSVIGVTDRAPVEVIQIGELGGPKGDQGDPGPTGPQGPAGVAGPVGPAGADAEWVQMTQAAYDALAVKDPDTLYIIVD